MIIQLQSDNKPIQINPEYNIVESSPDSRIYIQLAPNSKEMPRRHDGELVLRNGWVHLDYDKDGFLIGLEIVEGDPFTGVTETIPYLQPINPLIQ
jgi:hypothetical protein